MKNITEKLTSFKSDKKGIISETRTIVSEMDKEELVLRINDAKERLSDMKEEIKLEEKRISEMEKILKFQ